MKRELGHILKAQSEQNSENKKMAQGMNGIEEGMNKLFLYDNR